MIHCHKLYSILILAMLIATGLFIDPARVWANDIEAEWNSKGFAIQGSTEYETDTFYIKFTPYITSPTVKNNYLSISEAYADWKITDNFGLSLGRKIIIFGPGTYGFPALGPLVPYPGNHFDTNLNNLVAEGYDQIGYHFTWGNLKYQKFYANVSEDSFRMLLAQRISYELGSFTLGASETALVNKEAPWVYYLPIPFMPIYGEQFISNRLMHVEVNTASNSAVDFDLTWHAKNGSKIYLQWYVDDRPWPDYINGQWTSPEWDRFWWKMGYQGGLEWRNAFNNPSLTLYTEYTRIDQYTYTGWHPGEYTPGMDWTYRGRMIGDSLGPDADRLILELKWDESPEWQWDFAYKRERHGEGKIGDQWTYVPGQTVVFLTGNVETSDALFVSARRKFDSSSLGATVGLIQTGNVRHLIGENEFSITLGVNYSVRF